MTPLTETKTMLFNKWIALPISQKRQIGRSINVDHKNINKFFLNQYSMTFNKTLELEKQLTQ
jgi:hypothetical protein